MVLRSTGLTASEAWAPQHTDAVDQRLHGLMGSVWTVKRQLNMVARGCLKEARSESCRAFDCRDQEGTWGQPRGSTAIQGNAADEAACELEVQRAMLQHLWGATVPSLTQFPEGHAAASIALTHSPEEP